jgi:HlyD family secretion protein
MKKRIVFFTILVSALIALSIRYYKNKKIFYYAGTLEATRIDISTQLASTLSKIFVQEGDSVKEGDRLAELSCEDVKNAAKFAEQNFDRYVKLTRTGTTSAETLENIETRKNDASIRLSWCMLHAPLPGHIVNRYHEPGEWVTPGTKILSLSDTRDVWSYIYVPQPMLAKLSLGMKVRAYLPEMDSKFFEGRIIKINEEAEFTPKNVQTREERSRLVFGIKISFKDANQEGILKPGMTLEVDIP